MELLVTVLPTQMTHPGHSLNARCLESLTAFNTAAWSKDAFGVPTLTKRERHRNNVVARRLLQRRAKASGDNFRRGPDAPQTPESRSKQRAESKPDCRRLMVCYCNATLRQFQ